VIEKIDHIGIAVRDFSRQLALYEMIFGLKCEKIEEVSEQKVRLAMLPVGETHFELLEPSAADSPIAKFIAKRGEGIHHIACVVADLEGALEKAKAGNVALIDERPRRGADGRKIAFIHPKSTGGVLFELCQLQ
jgi:methylmalonyl-CoA/ethylmalonyl-CoA epimerase